jgi:hypothetical protein
MRFQTHLWVAVTRTSYCIALACRIVCSYGSKNWLVP